MKLGLLIYSYATGTFSSRAMERASYDSMAVRYLCANHHPDHDTIAKFRRENAALLKACFVRVLELAREVGLLKLGTASVDGTKIAAQAAKRHTLRRDQLQEQLRRLEEEVNQLLVRAEEADGREPGGRHPVTAGTGQPAAAPGTVARGPAQARRAPGRGSIPSGRPHP